MRRWCQGQAVDKRCGVRPARGVKVRVLIQMGRIPRDGTVESRALKISVVRLVGGGGGGGGRRANG